MLTADASDPRARYVAIIADGNARWAQAHGLPVHRGHDAGADTLKARIADAIEFGLPRTGCARPGRCKH
jgi:undecaprenyl diphosphate synthase